VRRRTLAKELPSAASDVRWDPKRPHRTCPFRKEHMIMMMVVVVVVVVVMMMI